ncbi:unnamed protein product [Blepharisma stoltei]|uniref:Cytochrome b561 domain-containing protein n=1 Tax=Blepharisma stoltei TaxID=1481888 RepID=A0AAU9KAU8_9CILI|nr:unnamed protein product [Blepharisma stoltei]
MKQLWLAFFLLVAFVNSKPVSVMLSKYMNMSWEFIDDEVYMNFQCAAGWCGIGFARTMFGCDYIIIRADNQNPLELWDQYSGTHLTPPNDEDLGGKNDLVYVSGGFIPTTNNTSVRSSGIIDVTFKRKQNTGDKFDAVLYPGITYETNFAYRFEDSEYVQPDYFECTKLTFSVAQDGFKQSPLSHTTHNMEHHGFTVSFFWVVSLPLAVLVARYCKQYWWWYYVHLILAGSTVFATLIASAEAFKFHEQAFTTYDKINRFHSRLGFSLASLVVVQGLTGVLLRFFQNYTKNFGMTRQARRVHRVVGYSMLMVGLINCHYGWELYDDMILFPYWAMISVIVFGYLMFEFRYQFSHYFKIFAQPKWNLPVMTHQEAIKLIKEDKQELMFIDEFVIDIKKFKSSHPAGSYLLTASIGQDAGKFIAGCTSFDGWMMPYKHSRHALTIARSLAIAEIPYPQNFLLTSKSSQNESQEYMKWTVTQKELVSQGMYLLELSSDYYKMNTVCQSLSNIGKHFRVTGLHKGEEIFKYYSAIFCSFSDWAQEANEKGFTTKSYPKTKPGSIQFVIKLYEKGKMSQFMYSQNIGSQIILKGPLGTGLCLSQLKGHYLAFAGGTGIIPFLDLVYYIWKDAITNQDYFAPASSNTQRVNHFSLKIYIAFKNEEVAFAHDLFKATSELVGEKVLKVFYKTSSTEKSQAPVIIKSLIDDEIDLAWICGPSGFDRFVHDTLVEGGLDNHKIMIL